MLALNIEYDSGFQECHHLETAYFHTKGKKKNFFFIALVWCPLLRRSGFVEGVVILG